MVLLVIILFVTGFFFHPLWLLLVGYLIYFFASRDSRRDKAVESRVKKMVSLGREYAEFPELYYDAAKSYALAKGATETNSDRDSSSATILVNGRSYFVVFIRHQTGNGTSMSVRDSCAVRAEIERDFTERMAPKPLQKAVPGPPEKLIPKILDQLASAHLEKPVAKPSQILFPKTFQPELPPKPNYRELGKLVAQGDAKALELLLKAAQDGEGIAELEVGFAYAKGFCVPRDYWIAAQWYGRAADRGVVESQFKLGGMYLLGRGMERSAKNALPWFEKAAEGGHEIAMQSLPALTLEVALVEEEQAKWDRLGVNKVAGHVAYDLAQGFISDLKIHLADPEVKQELTSPSNRDGSSFSKAGEVEKAQILIYNISSATPLSIKEVFDCAMNDDWKVLETKPA